MQDSNSFSIMFYYIISSTYQNIGDLFCLVHISKLLHSVLCTPFMKQFMTASSDFEMLAMESPKSKSNLIQQHRAKITRVYLNQDPYILCTKLLQFGSGVESVQYFLINLDIKPLMHLLEISLFSLNNVIIRLTKIMNRAKKNWAHFQ